MLSMLAMQKAYCGAARVLTTVAEEVGDVLLCQVQLATPVGELRHQDQDADLARAASQHRHGIGLHLHRLTLD